MRAQRVWHACDAVRGHAIVTMITPEQQHVIVRARARLSGTIRAFMPPSPWRHKRDLCGAGELLE
jgi:hypothetical protein